MIALENGLERKIIIFHIMLQALYIVNIIVSFVCVFYCMLMKMPVYMLSKIIYTDVDALLVWSNDFKHMNILVT